MVYAKLRVKLHAQTNYKGITLQLPIKVCRAVLLIFDSFLYRYLPMAASP